MDVANLGISILMLVCITLIVLVMYADSIR